MTADEVDLDFLRESARGFLTGRGEKDSLKDLAAFASTIRCCAGCSPAMCLLKYHTEPPDSPFEGRTPK